jgi:hypothetical protein
VSSPPLPPPPLPPGYTTALPPSYVPPPPVGIVLTDTSKATLDHGIKCLIYGRSGIGKTRLMATAPGPIIVSAEGGLLSLRQQKVPAFEIKTLDDLNRILDYLMGPAGKAYHTVCLDSISEIAEKVLANAKAGTKDGRQAYGQLADQMWATIRAFRDIKGKCVAMTAKAEWVKDDNGVTRWMPSMPGKSLTQGLAYFFDEVFAYATFRGAQGEFSALQTKTDMQFEAKDRSGALDFYEYPDLTAIFTKIYGVAA